MSANGNANGPERMTLWFTDDERVGLDVRWPGGAGPRRAVMARDRLRSAGHPVTLTEDELGWKVRLGPVDRQTISEIVSRFLERR